MPITANCRAHHNELACSSQRIPHAHQVVCVITHDNGCAITHDMRGPDTYDAAYNAAHGSDHYNRGLNIGNHPVGLACRWSRTDRGRQLRLSSSKKASPHASRTTPRSMSAEPGSSLPASARCTACTHEHRRTGLRSPGRRMPGERNP